MLPADDAPISMLVHVCPIVVVLFVPRFFMVEKGMAKCQMAKTSHKIKTILSIIYSTSGQKYENYHRQHQHSMCCYFDTINDDDDYDNLSLPAIFLLESHPALGYLAPEKFVLYSIAVYVCVCVINKRWMLTSTRCSIAISRFCYC